jgi:hypothetical protein
MTGSRFQTGHRIDGYITYSAKADTFFAERILAL